MKKSISVRRTASYQFIPAQNSKHLLYLIHGYGQLAEEFVKDFKTLEGKINIIAPEALSRYYNKKGKPVASWMTSHEREAEMGDYVNYLNDLHQLVCSEKKYEKVHLLGYSQGVSTAMRWLANCHEYFSDIYLCSGSIPPELDRNDLKMHLKTNFHYFYGDSDPLLSASKAEQQIDKLKALVDQVNPHQFSGGHIISESCIDLIASKL
jgi:predicted esterase